MRAVALHNLVAALVAFVALGLLYASGSHAVVYTLPPRAENPCILEIEQAVQQGLADITCTSNGIVYR